MIFGTAKPKPKCDPCVYLARLRTGDFHWLIRFEGIFPDEIWDHFFWVNSALGVHKLVKVMWFIDFANCLRSNGRKMTQKLNLIALYVQTDLSLRHKLPVARKTNGKTESNSVIEFSDS